MRVLTLLFNADGGYNQLNYLLCSQMMSRCRVVALSKNAGRRYLALILSRVPPHTLVRNLDSTTSTALFAAPLPASIIRILNSRHTCCLEMMIGGINASCRLDNAI